MKTLRELRKWLLSFLIGICVGFGLAYGHGHREVVIVPSTVVQRPAGYQAALLQCPVSPAGLREWHEACKVRRRMELVR